MKNRKPYEGKWMAAAALGALFSLQAVCTAFGADGTWIPDGNRWKYERSDGSMAAGTWEDIDVPFRVRFLYADRMAEGGQSPVLF